MMDPHSRSQLTNPAPVVSEQPTPTDAEIIDVLADVDLFDTLSYANLERLIAAGQQRRLEQGDYLFRAGDPPDSFHVLLAGAIEVVRSTPDNPEPTPVVYLFPGEAIGDMGLFTRSARRSAGRRCCPCRGPRCGSPSASSRTTP